MGKNPLGPNGWRSLSPPPPDSADGPAQCSPCVSKAPLFPSPRWSLQPATRQASSMRLPGSPRATAVSCARRAGDAGGIAAAFRPSYGSHGRDLPPIELLPRGIANGRDRAEPVDGLASVATTPEDRDQ